MFLKSLPKSFRRSFNLDKDDEKKATETKDQKTPLDLLSKELSLAKISNVYLCQLHSISLLNKIIYYFHKWKDYRPPSPVIPYPSTQLTDSLSNNNLYSINFNPPARGRATTVSLLFNEQSRRRSSFSHPIPEIFQAINEQEPIDSDTITTPDSKSRQITSSLSTSPSSPPFSLTDSINTTNVSKLKLDSKPASKTSNSILPFPAPIKKKHTRKQSVVYFEHAKLNVRKVETSKKTSVLSSIIATKSTNTISGLSSRSNKISFSFYVKSRSPLNTPSPSSSLAHIRWKNAISQVLHLIKIASSQRSTLTQVSNINEKSSIPGKTSHQTVSISDYQLPNHLFDYFLFIVPVLPLDFISSYQNILSHSNYNLKDIEKLLLQHPSDEWPLSIIDRYPLSDFSAYPVRNDWTSFAFSAPIISLYYQLPHIHYAVITLANGIQLYATFLVFSVPLKQFFLNQSISLLANPPVDYYISCAYSLISHYPLLFETRDILFRLFYYRFNEISVPFEKYLLMVMKECPLPYTCTIKLSFSDPLIHSSLSNSLILSLSPSRHPLSSSIPLKILFSTLSLENILGIFTCLLLEYRIFLHSASTSQLVIISQSFHQLLYPFFWCSVYIPVLPGNMLDAFMCPQPYLMGCLSQYIPQLLEMELQNDVVLVDIDHNSIRSLQTLPSLPEYAGSLLYQSINDIFEIDIWERDSLDPYSLINSSSTTSSYPFTVPPPSPFNKMILQKFLVFFGNICRNYQRYLFYIHHVPFFNASDFLNDKHLDDIVESYSFYHSFLSSRAFDRFLESEGHDSDLYKKFLQNNSQNILDQIFNSPSISNHFLEISSPASGSSKFILFSSSHLIYSSLISSSANSIFQPSSTLYPLRSEYLKNPRDYSIELCSFPSRPLPSIQPARQLHDHQTSNILEKKVTRFMKNVFSGETLSVSLQEMISYVKHNEIRTQIASILHQPHIAHLCLPSSSFTTLSSLLLSFLDQCVEHNDYDNAYAIMSICGQYYTTLSTKSHHYLEDELRHHSFWHNIDYWQHTLNNTFHYFAKNHPSSPLNVYHDFLLQTLITLLHQMSSFGVDQNVIEAYVMYSCSHYNLPLEIQKTLNTLVSNIILALSENQ